MSIIAFALITAADGLDFRSGGGPGKAGTEGRQREVATNVGSSGSFSTFSLFSFKVLDRVWSPEPWACLRLRESLVVVTESDGLLPSLNSAVVSEFGVTSSLTVQSVGARADGAGSLSLGLF